MEQQPDLMASEVCVTTMVPRQSQMVLAVTATVTEIPLDQTDLVVIVIAIIQQRVQMVSEAGKIVMELLAVLMGLADFVVTESPTVANRPSDGFPSAV